MSVVESRAGSPDGWADVPWPDRWAAKGRCRTVPASLFFPAKNQDADQAREVCAHCPVIAECRAYALVHPRLVGVWAGLTVEERDGLRRGTAAPWSPVVHEPDPPPPVAPSCPGCGYAPVGGRKHCPGCLAALPGFQAGTAPGTLLRTLGELADYPGRWARVAHYAASHSAPSIASQLRNGRMAVPPGRWRFEGRTSTAGGSDLYAYLEEAS